MEKTNLYLDEWILYKEKIKARVRYDLGGAPGLKWGLISGNLLNIPCVVETRRSSVLQQSWLHFHTLKPFTIFFIASICLFFTGFIFVLGQSELSNDADLK